MDFSVISAKRASTDLVALESADRQVLATGTTTGSQAPVTVSVKAGLRYEFIDSATGKAVASNTAAGTTQTTEQVVTVEVTDGPKKGNASPAWQASALSGVNPFDVASNLVFKSDKALKVGTANILISDNTAAGAGFRGDVNDKDQSIHVTKALAAGWISFSADKKTVSINPQLILLQSLQDRHKKMAIKHI